MFEREAWEDVVPSLNLHWEMRELLRPRGTQSCDEGVKGHSQSHTHTHTHL